MNFARILKPLENRIRNMVARAVVSLVDDSQRMQLLQVGLLADEDRDGIERVQNYGFTSVPQSGAEAVVLFVGGRRDHGLAVAVDDRRYRVKDLQAGEVAIYTDQGDKIHIARGGTITVTASTKVTVNAPIVELAGNTEAALKGTSFNSALSTFLTALGTYVSLIQPIADPSGTGSITFATAATTFGAATGAALSTKVKVG